MKRIKRKPIAEEISIYLNKPRVHIAIDMLVILSILLNIYALYQNQRMDSSLDRLDAAINTMNITIVKSNTDLIELRRSIYPDILAAHMEAIGNHSYEQQNNSTCIDAK